MPAYLGESMLFDPGAALSFILGPMHLLLMAASVAFGIIMGAVPGLTSTLGVALLLPFTFGLDPALALIMLGSVYCGGEYGGSISAILLNTPGTAAALCTTFDGHPLARQGKAGLALNASLFASVIGGLMGVCALFFFSLPLASASMQFGAPEQFWLCVFALTVVASLASGNLLKGIIGSLIGLLLACIGMDPVSGSARLTFNTLALAGGINVVPTLIGLFAIPQAIILASSANVAAQLAPYKSSPGIFVKTFFTVISKVRTLAISSIVGIIVGILPGAGGNIGSFIAYNEARRFSREPEKFGTGCIDGVIAPECANNAVVGGSQIPLLTLGIPGSAPAAVLLGALMTHGIKPGFALFTENGQFVYTYILGLFVACLFILVVGSLFIRIFAKILTIPKVYTVTTIFCLAVAGAYAIRGLSMDVYSMLGAGIIGYALLRLNFNLAPVALGLILGGTMEEGFKLSLLLAQSEDSPWLFMFARPQSQVLIGLSLLSLLYSAVREIRERKKNARGTC